MKNDIIINDLGGRVDTLVLITLIFGVVVAPAHVNSRLYKDARASGSACVILYNGFKECLILNLYIFIREYSEMVEMIKY